MSNAVETELRGLINELQGLYRQCAADNAEIKRKITALEENFKSLETHLSIIIGILCDEEYSSIIPQLKALKKQLNVGKNENMDLEQIYKQYHELEEKGVFYCLLCKFYDKDNDYCSYRKKQPERYYHCPYAEYTDLVWYIILRVLINLLKQLEGNKIE